MAEIRNDNYRSWSLRTSDENDPFGRLSSSPSDATDDDTVSIYNPSYAETAMSSGHLHPRDEDEDDDIDIGDDESIRYNIGGNKKRHLLIFKWQLHRDRPISKRSKRGLIPFHLEPLSLMMSSSSTLSLSSYDGIAIRPTLLANSSQLWSSLLLSYRRRYNKQFSYTINMDVADIKAAETTINYMGRDTDNNQIDLTVRAQGDGFGFRARWQRYLFSPQTTIMMTARKLPYMKPVYTIRWSYRTKTIEKDAYPTILSSQITYEHRGRMKAALKLTYAINNRMTPIKHVYLQTILQQDMRPILFTSRQHYEYLHQQERETPRTTYVDLLGNEDAFAQKMQERQHPLLLSRNSRLSLIHPDILLECGIGLDIGHSIYIDIGIGLSSHGCYLLCEMNTSDAIFSFPLYLSNSFHSTSSTTLLALLCLIPFSALVIYHRIIGPLYQQYQTQEQKEREKKKRRARRRVIYRASLYRSGLYNASMERLAIEERKEKDQQQAGLIIEEATYGWATIKSTHTIRPLPAIIGLTSDPSSFSSAVLSSGTAPIFISPVLDVRIPLLFFIRDSQLELTERPKCKIMGFYPIDLPSEFDAGNCMLGIYIRYRHAGVLRHVFVAENEGATLPSVRHCSIQRMC